MNHNSFNDEFVKALREAAGEGAFGEIIAEIIALDDCAKRVRTEYAERYPEQAEAIMDKAHNKLLSPTDSDWRPPIFEAHLREMLDRFVAGADLEPITDAELLSGMAGFGLHCPTREIVFLVEFIAQKAGLEMSEPPEVVTEEQQAATEALYHTLKGAFRFQRPTR